MSLNPFGSFARHLQQRVGRAANAGIALTPRLPRVLFLRMI